MNFKQWMTQGTGEVQETGTSTADVANFARPCLPLVTRQWPEEPGEDKKRKKKFKQPQVED